MDVFNLQASLTLNTKDYEAALNGAKSGLKDVGTEADGASGKSQTFADVLKANLAGEAIIAGLKKVANAVAEIGMQAFNAYADFEQLTGGAQLMYGDAYATVAANAKNAYKTVQLSQNDYLEQANGFATALKTSLGGNSEAAAQLADDIITAEADVVAATGVSQEAIQNGFNGILRNTYVMLDNLKLGITPTKEGFQEMIDTVNEWNAAQGTATEYSIDNMADSYSALIDYIEMQGLAGYAAMEGSETITGSINTMKSAWENFLVTMSSDDGPRAVGEAVTAMTDAAEDALDNSSPTVLNWLANLAQMPYSMALQGTDEAYNVGADIPDTADEIRAEREKLQAELDEAEKAYKNPWIDDSARTYYSAAIDSLQTRMQELTAAEDAILFESISAAGSAAADPEVTRAALIRDQADDLTAAAQGFADSMTEIMESYYETYQSIYDGFYNASTLFTENMEATKYSGDDVRKTLEENTEFYREYGENLEYLTNGAALDGIDITQLVSILQQMNTEQAAGITAMIAGEVEAAGATEGGETPGEVLQGWMDDLTEYSQAVGGVTEPMAQTLSGLQTAIDEAFETYSSKVADFEMGAEATAAGKETVDGLATGINSSTSAVTAALGSLANAMKSTLETKFESFVLNINANINAQGANASNADGLGYVPFDGFISSLHQGEMVLTAEQAAAYRKSENGNSGITINQYISASDVSEVELAAATEAYFTRARWA